MKYLYFATPHNYSQEMGKYICLGFSAIVNYNLNAYIGTSTTAITYGILRGSDKLIKQCEASGTPYIYVDHAYFFQCRGNVFEINDQAYFRMVRNNRYSSYIAGPRDRWDKLGITMKPFHKKGSKIVVVPMSRFVAAFNGVDPDAWWESTVQEISKHTDREIVKKPKSSGEIEGLDELFDDAHCLVTHDSLSAISALCNGVPCFTSEDNPAAQLSLQDLSKIEDPHYPSHEEMVMHFTSLSWQQFTLAEIESGYARSILEG